MFTGAGIFIIELYKLTPVVVLFGFNKTNFSEPGGSLEIGETIETCACRECREETENLINIKPDELVQISVPIIYKQYKSYIIYIQNLSARDYIYNANQIFNTCPSMSWKETNTITRINLHDIINAAQNYLDYAYDIYGNQCFVRSRTMDLVRQGASIFMNMINYSPIMLTRNLVMTSRMQCLIGTYSYTIKIHYVPNIKYAIYVIPKDKTFLNCSNDLIPHVTIAGFSDKFDYNQIKSHLEILNKLMAYNDWKINTKHVKIKNNSIQFKSKTLDHIANYLHENNFERVKNSEPNKWHITINCDIPKNIITILKKMKFYLCIVSKNDKFKLKKIL